MLSGAALAAAEARTAAMTVLQPPAAAAAAESAGVASAWDCLVDMSDLERKQAVHDIAYSVNAKYLKQVGS